MKLKEKLQLHERIQTVTISDGLAARQPKDFRKKCGSFIGESTYALDRRNSSRRTKGNAKVTLSRARGNFPIASDNFGRAGTRIILFFLHRGITLKHRRLVLHVFAIGNWLLSAVEDHTVLHFANSPRDSAHLWHYVDVPREKIIQTGILIYEHDHPIAHREHFGGKRFRLMPLGKSSNYYNFGSKSLSTHMRNNVSIICIARLAPNKNFFLITNNFHVCE